MASDHPILGRLEALVSRYRDDIARLTPELAHLRAEREIVMQYLSEFGTALNALISARQASDDKAAAEGKRADTAEAEVATLKAQIAADEATLKGMLDAADAEVARETGPSSGNVLSQTTAPVTTTTPSGATVTVDASAGTTTHEATDGRVTTLDHASGVATAVDATGTTVEPDPSAVAEAQDAKAAVVGATVGTGADSISGALGNDMVHEAV